MRLHRIHSSLYAMPAAAIGRSTAGVVAFVLGLLSSLALAAPAPAWNKVADDLQDAIEAPTTPQLNWAQDVLGVRYVKALIVADSSDPTLAALRAAVLADGGTVYFQYLAVSALSVMLPANQVSNIAARSDVHSISPNRPTTRTASVLEYTTGALAADVRADASLSYIGLDGSAVGIAVLDSGIDRNHRDMKGPDGRSRVVRAINLRKAGNVWVVGTWGWRGGRDAQML